MSQPDPALGVVFHAIGGLASASFYLGKGLLVATVAGVLSACMSYGFAAGKPIADLAVRHGAHPLGQNLPVLVVVLAGGLTTNLIWCLSLNHLGAFLS